MMNEKVQNILRVVAGVFGIIVAFGLAGIDYWLFNCDSFYICMRYLKGYYGKRAGLLNHSLSVFPVVAFMLTQVVSILFLLMYSEGLITKKEPLGAGVRSAVFCVLVFAAGVFVIVPLISVVAQFLAGLF